MRIHTTRATALVMLATVTLISAGTVQAAPRSPSEVVNAYYTALKARQFKAATAFVDTAPAECRRRNSARPVAVPTDVVANQLRRWPATAPSPTPTILPATAPVERTPPRPSRVASA